MKQEPSDFVNEFAYTHMNIPYQLNKLRESLSNIRNFAVYFQATIAYRLSPGFLST